jgi:hypothetical protein
VSKSRLLSKDHAARVVRSEVLEGGKVSSQLKSEKVEVMVEPAGEVACVIKVIVQYEKDGGELPPEDQGALAQASIGVAYLAAHPQEFA